MQFYDAEPDTSFFKVVPREPSGYKEEPPLVDVWKFATTMSGALCVTIRGVQLMLELSAFN